ncbi:MAG: hypothetical protein EPN30_05295 [Actinomycetota bacterium]|nr:MAG: hypothetical protein EPN30_05295 [Actinomycetota bacterium]
MSTFDFTNSSSWGGSPVAHQIAGAAPRGRLIVSGTVVFSETISSTEGKTYRCVVTDGTGEVELLFVGRENIPGLTTGAACTAEGTLGREGGRLIIWNPVYRLEPPD